MVELSQKERRVITLLVEDNYSNAAMAVELNTTEQCVKNIRYRLHRKFGVKTVVELVCYCIVNDLVDATRLYEIYKQKGKRVQ